MNPMEHKLTQLGITPVNADDFVPVPERELEQLEETIGGRLPDDYRSFLQRYGKSLFKEGVSCPSSPGLGPIPFAFFYGADASRDGVLTSYNFSEGDLPRGIVPIGEDGLGNLYCLESTGPTQGTIYYRDHSVGWEGEAEEYRRRGQAIPDSVKYVCLEKVAPSFTAFVLSLQPDED
jgi:hypothetical protein